MAAAMWKVRFLFRSAFSTNICRTTANSSFGLHSSTCNNRQILCPPLHDLACNPQKIGTFSKPYCTRPEETAENNAESEEETAPKHKQFVVHPPETSIRYLESKAYKDTYGSDPVWKNYRRNFKGQLLPRRTRARCIRNGVISTGSPCPLCRDEYLVVHHTNTKLLEQFISPYSGETISPNKTGVCRRRQFYLDLEIMRAKDLGLITFQVPFRHYNYEEYYPELKQKKQRETGNRPEE
ncbi:small ribosomal subunit protein mS40-like [Ornithodoros turicata]|uniref:small ribosomal subunit protein mS40-like n=1 Tax=Ornithodoros turicata TaxID=34597 RepID=UPI003139F05C